MHDASSDGIHFDTRKGTEWLNGVFQRHLNLLDSDLLETAQFTFGPPPIPPFFAHRSLSSRLGARSDSRDCSRSSRTRPPGSTPMEAEEAESSTPQSSLVSSVVVVDNKRMERPAETSRTRYSERVKELDLEEGRIGSQKGIGRGLGAQGCVTRGLESTPLCRLVEGPRGTLLKWEDNGIS